MPVYESEKNATNFIKVKEDTKNSAMFGWQQVIDYLAGVAIDRGGNVALDAWYGTEVEDVAKALKDAILLKKPDINIEVYSTRELFVERQKIIEYNAPYVTEDPGFGRVNRNGTLEDIFDGEKLEALKKALQSDKKYIVYGEGASAVPLKPFFKLVAYVDNTHQKVQWDMWTGKLCTFGCAEPPENYSWKEYNYSDYYLLAREKEHVIEFMDFYLENYKSGDLKLLTKDGYHDILSTLVKYPIHEVKIFSPGPWGAYRFLDMDYGVEGLSNNAWNKIAGPELRIVIDFGAAETVTMPMLNVMRYGKALVGELIDRKYPKLFPLDIWLDDGYHPTPQPAERISMPLHIHPSSKYVEEHFDEPLGRYETYYIAEAYEGANTWMGFKDDADIEDWERKCKESNNLTVIENWRDFIENWESREGDLYLIPPGTMHGHGGNQMVLEMDTNPSINGTEYSFFEYDFARHSWDDDNKTMTAKPLKMHLEHGVNMEKNRRAGWVKENLLARPSVVKWTKDYWIDQYSTIPSMPYHVERIHFEKKGEYSTEGKFMHMLTLTVGSKVKVVSKANSEYQTELHKFHTVVIPAFFGDYEVINEEGGRVTAVIQRWKEG